MSIKIEDLTISDISTEISQAEQDIKLLPYYFNKINKLNVNAIITKYVEDHITEILNGKTIVVADHGTAATDEVINVCYGTSTPPTASTTTIGTLFIKYIS